MDPTPDPIEVLDLCTGDVVGHYRVGARLGAGGNGCVYRVEHLMLGRVSALKVLHRELLAQDPASVARFLREARAASRIRHPHVVDVFDFGFVADGRPYFVMEQLVGPSLLELLDHGALPVARVLTLACQLGAALAAAHACGVIHADVSASNLIVQRGDHVKLLDFGLAELRTPVARGESDVFFGTPCYIAPELVRGLPADERSDQYSFGVLLWEMIAGRPPFDDSDPRELCTKHLREVAPAPRSSHGPVPPALAAVIARCMAKSPGARFPSMRTVSAELALVLAGLRTGRRQT